MNIGTQEVSLGRQAANKVAGGYGRDGTECDPCIQTMQDADRTCC
jgi:hypothetical protein